MITSLLILITLITTKIQCAPQMESEVLTIPSNLDSVKTLQQMLNDKSERIREMNEFEEEQKQVFEVPVDADFEVSELSLEDLQQQQSLGKKRLTAEESDTQSRILAPAAFSKVTSNIPSRLSLSPATRLYGTPGETVQLEFFLLNLGPINQFTTLAREDQLPPENGDGVNFPESQMTFLTKLSEVRPTLDTNETRTIVLTLKIPYQTSMGTRRMITLEIQPHGNNAAGSSNSLVRQLIFTVSSTSSTDRDPPRCQIIEDSFEEQCGQYQFQGACESRSWTAKFGLIDSESGMRSLSQYPRAVYNDPSVFFSHDNFVIGSSSPVDYLFAGSCCSQTSGVIVTAFDVDGNEVSCRAGSKDFGGNQDQNVQAAGLSKTVIIIIAVVVSVLVLIIIVSGVVIWLLKRKRKIELAEMRQSPQAR